MKMLRPDSKGRISLGAFTKGISGFSVHQETNGKIILEPFIEIPARDQWLLNNQSSLEKVKKGIEQAKNGLVVDKGSFSQYSEDEDHVKNV